MNPCGRVVDVMRVPHTTKCQFFRDSDTVADVIWYPTNPGAPLLGSPSMISNSFLDPEFFFFLPGGEVYGADRPFNFERAKPGALGGHVCGTPRDFAEGCAFDNAAPAVTYRTDQLPNCCGALAGARGGGAGGGRSSVVVTNNDGHTCATAVVVTSGVGHTFVMPAGSTRYIRVDGVAPGQDIHAEVITDAGSLACDTFHGTCSLPFPDHSGTATPGSPFDDHMTRVPATGPEFLTAFMALFQPTGNVTMKFTIT